MCSRTFICISSNTKEASLQPRKVYGLNKSSRLGDTEYTLVEDSMFIGLETTKLT